MKSTPQREPVPAPALSRIYVGSPNGIRTRAATFRGRPGLSVKTHRIRLACSGASTSRDLSGKFPPVLEDCRSRWADGCATRCVLVRQGLAVIDPGGSSRSPAKVANARPIAASGSLSSSTPNGDSSTRGSGRRRRPGRPWRRPSPCGNDTPSRATIVMPGYILVRVVVVIVVGPRRPVDLRARPKADSGESFEVGDDTRAAQPYGGLHRSAWPGLSVSVPHGARRHGERGTLR